MTYSEEALKALEASREEAPYTSIIPLRAARQYGLEAVLAAYTAAYIAHIRGLSIARRPGIDALLYLAGTRNIAEALARLAPRPGDQALALCTPQVNERLHKLLGHTECSIPHSDPLSTTRAALAPLELRAYKPQEAVQQLRASTQAGPPRVNKTLKG